MKQKIRVTVTEDVWVDIIDGEDITNRLADIYLHGAGERGYTEKTDIGGVVTIEVLETEVHEMVLMIVGEFEFNVDEKSPEEYPVETHLIHRVDILKYVERTKALKIGEKHLAEGYDAYMVLDDYDPLSIISKHEWFHPANDGGVVVFDKHMQFIVGFDHETEAYQAYPNAKEVGSKLISLNRDSIYTEHPPRFSFKWEHYDGSKPRRKEVEPEPIQESSQEPVRPSVSTIEEHGTVLSSIAIEKALRDEGTDWDDDAFCCWFDGKDIVWIGDCDGYNFDGLPEEIKEVLKRRLAVGGYYGIYYDS